MNITEGVNITEVMNIEVIAAIAAFVGVVIVLARAVVADGYGVRPGPRSHDDDVVTWRMPHDEPRRSAS